MKISDQQIISTLNSDLQKGVDQLFARYYKPLVLLSNAYLNNMASAEDVVQDQIIKFWKQKKYQNINANSLGNYLFSMVKNASFNQIKKNDVLSETLEFSHLDIAEEEAKRIADEGIAIVKNALNELPERTRLAVEYVLLHKMKYQEAADELGISINSLKTLLKRGVAKLKELLKDHKELFNLFFL